MRYAECIEVGAMRCVCVRPDCTDRTDRSALYAYGVGTRSAFVPNRKLYACNMKDMKIAAVSRVGLI
jgi:hypothetical protein